ncbi:PKD domain-containing protein [candidate division KSB1 bacterium]|nr:PKD domain-containing protein [candidate division KSB1 bacterium]
MIKQICIRYMVIYLSIFLLAFEHIVNAQTVSVIWSQSYGNFYYGAPYHYASMVQPTNDKGYILCGSKLIKTDSDGNSTSIHDLKASCILQTGDGSYLLTQRVNNNAYLVKLTSSYNQIWSKNLTTLIQAYEVYNMQHAPNGGYLLCGKTTTGKAFWGKVNDAGTVLWSQSYNVTYASEARCISSTSDGGYIAGGSLNNIPAIFKLTNNGSLNWTASATLTAPFIVPDLRVVGVYENENHTFTFCYNDIKPAYEQGYFVLAKTDVNGNIVLTTEYLAEGINSLTAYHMAKTEDGGFIICGKWTLAQYALLISTIIRTNADGVELWRKQIKGKGNDSVPSYIVPINSNTYVFCGRDYGYYEDDYGSNPRLVKIREYLIESVDFSAYPRSGSAPFTVQFTDLTVGSVLKYKWDFGDGEVSSDRNPFHIYRDPGSYHVTLTVSDGSKSYSKTRNNYILVSPGGTETYDVLPAKIAIDGNLSDWSGLEILSPSDNPENLYPESDLLGEAMMAWNGVDKWYIGFSVSDNFIGKNSPFSSFADDPNGKFGISRYYINDCIEAIFAKDAGGSYFEAFKAVFAPDETERTLYQSNNIHAHSWIKWGSLNPLLAPDGDRSPKVPPICETKIIQNGTNWQGEAALTIKHKPPSDSLYRFIFSFNDIDDNDGASTRHHMNTTGGDLDVWDALAQLFGAMPILNFIDDEIHAAFTADTLSGFKPLTVNFTDQSSGIIDSYLWDFGDGQTAQIRNPQHVYTNTGVYSVTLIVNGQTGADTLTRADYINVQENIPVANFEASPLQGERPLTVQFTNLSTGIMDSCKWNFGDGTKSNERNPEHTFQSADSFTVSLIVSGPGGIDAFTRVNYIIVKEPSAIEKEKEIPTFFVLYQNYPNPFNPVTKISFSVPRATHVQIKIYNTLGKMEGVLLDEKKEAGEYSINWNADKLSSGVYYYRLQAGNFSDVKKMILLR